jgi:hypothetical protein
MKFRSPRFVIRAFEVDPAIATTSSPCPLIGSPELTLRADKPGVTVTFHEPFAVISSVPVRAVSERSIRCRPVAADGVHEQALGAVRLDAMKERGLRSS